MSPFIFLIYFKTPYCNNSNFFARSTVITLCSSFIYFSTHCRNQRPKKLPADDSFYSNASRWQSVSASHLPGGVMTALGPVMTGGRTGDRWTAKTNCYCYSIWSPWVNSEICEWSLGVLIMAQGAKNYWKWYKNGMAHEIFREIHGLDNGVLR